MPSRSPLPAFSGKLKPTEAVPQPQVAARALLAAIETGTAPTILDVRSRWEYSRGHVPGALNIPLQTLVLPPAALAARLEDPVVVYCGHGPRALMAIALLRRHGFHRVYLLEGHMSGWTRAGLCVERVSGSSQPRRRAP